MQGAAEWKQNIGLGIGLAIILGFVVLIIVGFVSDPFHGASRCFTFIDYNDGTYGSIDTLCDGGFISSVTPPSLTRMVHGQPDPATPAIFPSIDSFATPTATAMARNPDGSMTGSGTTCPLGFLIKGDESTAMYYAPGQQLYDRANARHCFATESDAMHAGYGKT